MVKTVTVLGSTGSIGKSTLKLIRENADKFKVAALTGNKNIELLVEQAREFKPEVIAVADESQVKELRAYLPDVKVMNVCDAVREAKADIVIAGIVGSAGLEPVMAAIETAATIGLANKEAMVCAGNLINAAAKKYNAKIIPVDSEHNAIYQVFDFANPASVEKIILTASGGPFLNFSAAELEQVTPEQAVNHPNWKMGAKISVDSATMMNKGLEMIEAFYLFPVKAEQIDVIVHPESVIHSMVSYNDGSVLAQAAAPDMCVPISYVLGYPERLKNNSKRLDLTEFGKLHFIKPDYKKFPCLALAIESLKASASHQIVLNAANEIAVEKFLNREIKFTDIAKVVEKSFSAHSEINIDSLQDVLALDSEIRTKATEFCKKAA